MTEKKIFLQDVLYLFSICSHGTTVVSDDGNPKFVFNQITQLAIKLI